MKISVVIPHWPKTPQHDIYLQMCKESIEYDADEIIVEVNDGIGFAKACNLGLAKTKGDYICVVNNDTELVHGELKTLCKPNTIMVPRMLSGQVDNMPRAFYCMPRGVYEKVGGYDEQFEMGFYEDDDMIRRWTDAGYNIEVTDKVKVSHFGGLTMREINPEELTKKNRERFNKKWHIDR